jgi:hypothetical protein
LSIGSVPGVKETPIYSVRPAPLTSLRTKSHIEELVRNCLICADLHSWFDRLTKNGGLLTPHTFRHVYYIAADEYFKAVRDCVRAQCQR